ncbi:MAG: DNA mismatch repair protein MutS [Pseudomonadota bacterium]
MIRQYQAIKSAHPDMLLFYRMGDFYELFFDDAVQAAAALDIALTRRGKHDGEDIPMCGVPVHNAESYLQRLIRSGFRVAVCEQLEDPAEARKRPGAQKLVQRDVVRIVTPGTLTEDELLDARSDSLLVALADGDAACALAWLDLSSGAFGCEALAAPDLAAALARLQPRELLVGEDRGLPPALAEWQSRAVPLPRSHFEPANGERRVREALGLATLDGLGAFDGAELAAAGAVLAYVELTQKGQRPPLQPLVGQRIGERLLLDPATRRNLELVEAMGGGRQGSLLHTVDRTITAAGARRLHRDLAGPLTDRAAIARRHDRIEALVGEAGRRRELRATLREAADLERAVARLGLGRGGPRDLAAVGRTLGVAAQVAATFAAAPPPLAALADPLTGHETLASTLTAALVETPPRLAREGEAIRSGYDTELDTARSLRDRGRQHIAALEGRLRETTGVATLKIRHNSMLGYFVEVGSAHADRLPATFVRRQGLANASRFGVAELSDLEQRLVEAEATARRREHELLDALTEAVLAEAASLAAVAKSLAALDVAAAWAELAATERWVRPELSDDLAFDVEAVRHPVVEAALTRERAAFVANDCQLGDDSRLWLLTGPNMAGKSTFLRQNALLAVLAQAGAFVPAARCRLGIVDRLFSRVGAADDLARGRSTFMVEMVETAAILNQASQRSLVILDEIGRGTATHDGLSLAWAVVEYLHDVVRCRGLFATHFHELTSLEARLERLSCHSMQVREWRSEVVFLHEVAPGAADRSYGLHVARLAGLPPQVTARAQVLLDRLERQARAAPTRLVTDLPLFQEVEPAPIAPSGDGPLGDALRAIDPDMLSPREALEALYRLRVLLDDAADQA